MSELRNGSYKAFDAIYHLYAKRLYHYVYQGTRSSRDAEEIVQDVFVNLWKYRTSLDDSKSLSSLLFTVAKRYRINALKAIVNSPVYEDYVTHQHELLHHDSSPIEYNQFIDQVRRAMSTLSDAQRRVVQMSRFEQLSHNEIATILNINVRTVANLLSAGLKRLKIELDKYPETLIIILLMV